MTMFTLPNFCRVCLKYDKNLIDLEHIENEPSETLMTKLTECVSEVEWTVFKPLLCHPCIKRLNIAYGFKKQCIQSSSMLKSYVALVKDTKKKESQETSKGDASQSNAYMMLPNQKYIKIVVGPQSQNSFQNVFLNVVPTTTLNTTPQNSENKNKDTNQNVFLNINNTIQKFIPNSNEQKSDVTTLLTESKTEEVSVEIDPTDLNFGDGGSSENEEDENSANDWEELISSSQILSKVNGTAKSENVAKSNMYGNYVPILPKQSNPEDSFFNSGQHFLSSQLYSSEISCETCQRIFSSSQQLRQHMKEFHSNQRTYKCDYCYNEYIFKADYEACVRGHKLETDPLSTCLTLNDFKNNPSDPEKIVSTDTTCATPQELQNLTCEICYREFNTTSGLLRHKVRKHNQKNKKKYFIKGMKNAKCDICNREFSTQSYMQLHRKLHLRDDIGYKYKVFGKNRYVSKKEIPEKKNKAKSESDDDNSKELSPPEDNQRKLSNKQKEVETTIQDEIMEEEDTTSE